MILPPTLSDIKSSLVIASVVALAFIGSLLTAYTHGRHVAEGEIAQAQRDIALAYAKRIVEQQTDADQLTTENATLRNAQAPRDRIITREVIRYETATDPALRCRLPGAFRLLHDAAATGDATLAEAGPLATASADPVDDAALLKTLDDNYRACRDAIAQVEAWQRRYRMLEAPR